MPFTYDPNWGFWTYGDGGGCGKSTGCIGITADYHGYVVYMRCVNLTTFELVVAECTPGSEPFPDEAVPVQTCTLGGANVCSPLHLAFPSATVTL